MLRQSAVAQGYGGQAERQNTPLFLKRGGVWGGEKLFFS